MPITSTLINGGTGLLLVGEGIVSGPELVAGVYTARQLVLSSRMATFGLIDFTRISALNVSANEIKIIVEADKVAAMRIPKFALAVAAPRDVAYGLSRMYELYLNTPGWSVAVFRTMDEAWAWLESEVPGAGAGAAESSSG